MKQISIKISDGTSYADKDVNDCDDEDEEKCWKITPANLATRNTSLHVRQNVLALGKK